MFDKKENFLNRELSWLKFNHRVLEEANDPEKPLLERLKFVAIASSNLDEFFMIRVAGLKQQVESGIGKRDPAGFNAAQQLQLIDEAVREMVRLQYWYLKKILGAMQNHDIYVSDVESLAVSGRQWVEEHFYNTIYPLLTPLAVNASHPFPLLANRSLNLAVLLSKGKEELQTAILPVPSALPRIIEVPDQSVGKQFVLLEDIIKKHCSELFCGYTIKDIVPFSITRNSDLLIDGEGAEDLLAEVEKSLRQRKRGEAVRLEMTKTNKSFLKNFLLDIFKMDEQDLYEVTGPIDISCFMKVMDLQGFDDLRYEPIIPQIPIGLKDAEDLFDVIREKDILLHHPYESFMPVVNFIRQAAVDPKVLAIKQTLYRVSGNSSIVRALAQAAENGKQVTVVVEVRARFDEENNILWARKLEESGCHVIYGLLGLKVHGKMALIIRQEEARIKRYVHMGTGNYNDITARIYSDMSLFTANEKVGADASDFFNMLLGYSEPPSWKKLVVAPVGLREKIKELIDREIALAQEGKSGHIIAKMNSLLDKDIILKLYEASSKGVKIDLIIRGICALKPGLEHVSQNIKVRSIVGRFLEHHRILYFANGGKEKIYLSSADWMNRNLSERIELLFPIDNPEILERIKNILHIMLKDNRKAYMMKSDGTYRRVYRRGKIVNSQQKLYQEAQERAGGADF
ncbi:RNA degradosome polyphosphate kinase [Pelosinus fermentans]|uniref:Polyphosphate kinase n=1 Tax=Pelosinus fermentans JBW45 TaxID=1192197 RepID=I9NUZ3_9FIRM|nr:RNA degradosome polyphosphate kinase [Pelosinus fermentans]AJQ29884.1 Polyphosphate kinase [Pelosinus fermentans JBW45]